MPHPFRLRQRRRAAGGDYTLDLSAVQTVDPSVLSDLGRGTELRVAVNKLLDRQYVSQTAAGSASATHNITSAGRS